MGTTSSGLPYPEDTDPVAQGAQAIKGLAQRQAPSAGGTVALTAANASTVTGSVTFPAGRFTTPPAVTVCANNGGWFGFQGTATATGTTLGVAQRDGTATSTTITAHWHAVGIG